MYKITFLALIFSTYSYAIDDYEAEYRFKSSQIDIIDVSPERTNTLKLEKVLSLG